MTITNTNSKAFGLGNSATTIFNYGFLIPDSDSIEVYYVDTSGTINLLSNTLYTVSGLGNAAGGTVTYPISGSPIASPAYIVICRVVPEQQNSTFTNLATVYPSSIEAALDYVTMICQDIQEQASRAVKLDITSRSTVPTLGAPVPNYYLAYDATGQNIIAVAGGGGGGGGGGGNVTGPGSSTSGNFSSFGNTSGTLIADSGKSASSFDAAGTAASAIAALVAAGDPFPQYALESSLGSMAEQSSNDVTITGGSITGMPSPSNAGDVANKAYVDATAALSGFTAVNPGSGGGAGSASYLIVGQGSIANQNTNGLIFGAANPTFLIGGTPDIIDVIYSTVYNRFILLAGSNAGGDSKPQNYVLTTPNGTQYTNPTDDSAQALNLAENNKFIQFSNGNIVCKNFAGSAVGYIGYTPFSQDGGMTFVGRDMTGTHSLGGVFAWAVTANTACWAQGAFFGYTTNGCVTLNPAHNQAHTGLTDAQYGTYLNGNFIFGGTTGNIAYKTVVDSTALTPITTNLASAHVLGMEFTGNKYLCWTATSLSNGGSPTSIAGTYTSCTTAFFTTAGMTGNIINMEVLGGTIVAVTDTGDVAKSINDGTSWTKLTSGQNPLSGVQITDIDTINNNFWIFGDNGLAAYSASGSSFTAITTIGFSSNQVLAMAASQLGSNAGIPLDGITDGALAVQNFLNQMGPGTLKLISQTGLYSNGLIALNSFQTLDMTECPLVRGPSCSIGTNGQLAESPTGGSGAQQKPHLFANISSGTSSFDIIIFDTNITPTVGSKFILRGQRTITGSIPDSNSERGYIATVTNTGISTGGGIRWTITTVSPVQNNYQVRYTGDAYELATGLMDYSAFTLATYSPFTGNVTGLIGGLTTTSATVANGALFNIGAYVEISDGQTVGSVMSITDNNPINSEVTRIVGISGNTLTFERALYHSYSSAANGGVTTISAVIGAKIIGVRSTPSAIMPADSDTLNYGSILRYSINSYMIDCVTDYITVAGVNYGQYGEFYRIQNCLNSAFINCNAHGKPDQNSTTYASGTGYAFVGVGATNCFFIGGRDYNCRHGHLLQDGSAGNEVTGFISTGARISAIDTHGINSIFNHIHDGSVVGGPLFSADATQKAAIRVGNSSHILGDFYNVIENIHVSGYAYNASSSGANQGYGIDMVVASGNNIVRDIVIEGCDYGINSTFNSSHTATALGANNLIQNVVIKGAALGATELNGGSSTVVGGMTLDNVTSDGNAVHFFGQQLSSLQLVDCKIRNSVNTSNQPSAQFTSVANLSIIENDYNGANEGIYIEECPGAQMLNNNLRNQLQSTVFKDNTTSGNNNGYIWSGNNYAGTSNPQKSLGTSTGIIKEVGAQNVNTQTGTAYTFGLIDVTNLVTASNTGAQTYTIPPHSSVPFDNGVSIDVQSINTGVVTIAAGAGVTLTTLGGGTLAASGARGKLTQLSQNTWSLSGDIT